MSWLFYRMVDNNLRARLVKGSSKSGKPVMWIRIDCIRIHKIWWIRIRIQANIITKLILKHIYKIKSSLSSEQEKYNFLRKKQRFLFFKLCFSLHLIPLDPDSHSESGSRSTDLHESGSDWIQIYITGKNFHFLKWLFTRSSCSIIPWYKMVV